MADLTDLEITKLCAEAMGLVVPSWSVQTTVLTVADTMGVLSRYDPLHDDAQAMALVKRFEIDLVHTAKQWHAELIYIDDNRLLNDEFAVSPNLNRAICECVAKMQREKSNG